MPFASASCPSDVRFSEATSLTLPFRGAGLRSRIVPLISIQLPMLNGASRPSAIPERTSASTLRMAKPRIAMIRPELASAPPAAGPCGREDHSDYPGMFGSGGGRRIRPPDEPMIGGGPGRLSRCSLIDRQGGRPYRKADHGDHDPEKRVDEHPHQIAVLILRDAEPIGDPVSGSDEDPQERI